MFKKILIANRGEIACRIMRTAHRLGIQCVAVYSEADINSLHVRMADESVLIGESEASKSYLLIDRIIAAAKETGAEAVHPGYGFLSENADFCRRLQEENIIFIGPNVEAIEQMGDKIQSKILADRAGIFTIPGHSGAVSNVEEAVTISRDIGYPIMLKASAGGGGKGMRLATNDSEVREGLISAMNEARSSFGDERILIEKFITDPRHIEIQIIADTHGNTIYLGERECSLQRRHQKVIEEAPSPHLDEATRAKMGEQAVALAQAVNYCSAGTVEFIVDRDRNFYFLEMNTRLQVEHPITEYITGLDLVESMLRIANGERLNLKQADVKLTGWAMESRIYAEDTSRGFLPSTGRLKILQTPQINDNVRLDTGVVQGSNISVFYDPMIAKLITYGSDRQQALQRMRLALDQYVIDGVSNNISFLSHLLGQKKIIKGDLSTGFIGENYPKGFSNELMLPKNESKHLALAALAFLANNDMQGESLVAFSANEKRTETTIEITQNENEILISCNGTKFKIKCSPKRGNRRLNGTIDGAEFSARTKTQNHIYEIEHDGYRTEHFIFTSDIAPYFRHMLYKTPADLSQFLLSPMPGIIKSINVKKGDSIKKGQALVTIEAMKMENILNSEKDAVIEEIFIKTGDSVQLDDRILSFE